jgi:hypothetical protein
MILYAPVESWLRATENCPDLEARVCRVQWWIIEGSSDDESLYDGSKSRMKNLSSLKVNHKDARVVTTGMRFKEELPDKWSRNLDGYE